MTHWQARATLENGAVMVFGAQAHTDEDALGLAETRLADTGQAVLDIEIEPLVVAQARER
jgi:hypothetical protein